MKKSGKFNDSSKKINKSSEGLTFIEKDYKIAEKKLYKLLLLTICYISNQISASIYQILTQLKSMSLIHEKSLLSGRDSFELPRHMN